MILAEREVDNLYSILYQIKQKARKKNLPKLTIENYRRKAMLILNKAARKKPRVTKLEFKQEDIETLNK